MGKINNYETVTSSFSRHEAARAIQSFFLIKKMSKCYLMRPLCIKGNDLKLEIERLSALFSQQKISKKNGYTVLLVKDQLCSLQYEANGHAKIKPLICHIQNKLSFEQLKSKCLKLPKNMRILVNGKDRTLILRVVTKRNRLPSPINALNSKKIAQNINDNQYEYINYNLPDFTYVLLDALRANLISMNGFITAKLMYESLIAFNGGVIPKNPRLYFKRHLLNDLEGPYQPDQLIEYWNFSHDKIILNYKEELVYYTIDLPYLTAVSVLYHQLSFQTLI